MLLCEQLVAEHADLAGIVIGHGTATLEETAYILNLTLKVAVPVVLVGAQRPSSALSTDAGLNLVNAIRVAASPEARGMGVLVVLNDEIQAARDVTKTSTLRLQTFRSADFGVLGHADGDAVAFYRRPVRRCCPDTEFDIRSLDALPRVDIAYAYAGGDGTAVRAFIAAGAKGIVSAGFAPGGAPPGEFEALKEAAAQGVVVMQCTRVDDVGRTELARELLPRLVAGHRDDAGCTQPLRGAHSAETDRAITHDHDGAPFGHARGHRGVVPGAHDVGERKQSLGMSSSLGYSGGSRRANRRACENPHLLALAAIGEGAELVFGTRPSAVLARRVLTPLRQLMQVLSQS